jgi:hypothetical protein
MAEIDQHIGEVSRHSLRPAVEARRHRLVEERNLGNLHLVRLLAVKLPPEDDLIGRGVG